MHQDDHFVLRIPPARIYSVLLVGILLLVALSTAAKLVMLSYPAEAYGAVNELCKRFYLDFENNVPAWFSTLGLFLASCLFGLIAYFHGNQQADTPRADAHHTRNRHAGMRYWMGLSLLFLAFALDEATYTHEILIVALRNRLDLGGIFYFAWVIPGAIFVALVAIIYLPFLLRLKSEIRNGLIIAGAFYVGGALGLELLGGYLAESRGFDAASYIAVMTCEETCELVGIATLNFVLLRYLTRLSPQIQVRWA